jgi:hypothetical protein
MAYDDDDDDVDVRTSKRGSGGGGGDDVPNYFDSAPLILWWDTGTHAAREESEFVELATAGLEMGTSGCFVATLGALNLGSRAFQVAFAVFGIKP